MWYKGKETNEPGKLKRMDLKFAGRGGVALVIFFVNQSPKSWNLGFEILELDFRLDNKVQILGI